MFKSLINKIYGYKIDYKLFLLLMLIITTLLLIPMIIIGFYDVPSSDDFGHCINTYHTWNETGSVIEVFNSSFGWVKGCYNSIGGTFVAYFFDTLCPSIFGEQYYFLTPFIILIPFIASIVYFSNVFYKRILKMDAIGTWIVTLATIIVSTQFLPSAAQGFYWYVGAFTYTVFFSLMIITITIVIKSVFVEDGKNYIIGIIIASLLSFCVGGGNYVSALTLSVLLLFIIVLTIIRNKHKGKIIQTLFHGGAFPLICWGIAFAINMLAPGNEGRKAMIDTPSPGLIKAVPLSFKETILQIDDWLSLPVIAMFVLMIPILWHYSSKTKFSFRFPAFVSMGSFCLLASMFFPTIYGQGSVGEGRLQNIVFFAFVILTYINIFYWCGWISNKTVLKPVSKKISLAFLCLIVFFIAFGTFATVKYPVTSVSAARSIIKGEASQYKHEAEKRFEILHSTKNNDVVIPGFSAKPYVIFTDKDICESENDPLYGRNEAVSDYYSQKSVLRDDSVKLE